MEVKPKKCRYSKCDKKFIPFRSTDPTCPNDTCRRGFEAERKKQKELKAKSYNKRKEQIANMATSHLKDTLQLRINRISKLLDRGHPCMGTGKDDYTTTAGHFFSIGAYPELRYHLMNIFNQDADDNSKNGGRGNKNYEGRLVSTFGLPVYESILALKRKIKSLHISGSELKDACRIAHQIIRKLESENKMYTTSERIEKRLEFNQLLGIYK
ncbi:MAG: Phi10:1 [Bacteroidetes bacterium]|jgi:hypothetical protein|nr:Phi10:1 [Bacteroidota bacterium]